jgi:hypothetical protein
LKENFKEQYLNFLENFKYPYGDDNFIQKYNKYISEKMNSFLCQDSSYEQNKRKLEKLKILYDIVHKKYYETIRYSIKYYDNYKEDYFINIYLNPLLEQYLEVSSKLTQLIDKHELTPSSEVKVYFNYDNLVISYTNKKGLFDTHTYHKADVVVNLASWHKGNHYSPFFFKEVRDAILELEEFKALKELIKLG